jgi:hypothetical protein
MAESREIIDKSIAQAIAESESRDNHGRISPANLQSLFREITDALKTIRYGSIVLTVHDGEVVELTQTVRRRTRAAMRH